MDWLVHSLPENSYIYGAIACVVTFVFLCVVRPKPMRTATSLAFCVAVWMVAAFEVMRFWPPTLVQSEILVVTILACFLIGLMLSRLGSITIDTATHEFVIERSVSRSALTALFAGVVMTLVTLYYDKSGGSAVYVAWGAWITGDTLGYWRRMVRAGGA